MSAIHLATASSRRVGGGGALSFIFFLIGVGTGRYEKESTFKMDDKRGLGFLFFLLFFLLFLLALD